ncbi:MAG: pyridoxal phosphate-dependent aminotransferase family protein [Deltaproteobacteria bacterium]|nr:pyridoxal phosphate-dependent aminotransferase family protein [Deltaproteobacteria bacterium]
MTHKGKSNLAEVSPPSLEGRLSLFSKGGKDVFSKAHDLVEADMARQMGIYPYYLPIDRNEGPVAIIDGKEVIMLGSNNYLGLTIHPEVREAAVQAIRDYGTSMTGSRLLNGTSKLHQELEGDLAEFFGKEASLVFTTGYQANLGVISALINEGAALVMDKGDHASIYDAARLSKGEARGYKHNDLADLSQVLESINSETGKLVIVDGVFSMEGDVVDLPGVERVVHKAGARLAVDDAHGVGILGPGGRGTAHHFGLQDKIDLMIGTFSKTLASIGGFVAGEAKVVDFIRHFGRSILFSASLPPASTAAAKKALEILKREPERVERVNQNGRYMRENLKSLGFDIGVSETPIVPIVVGDEILALTIWRELLDNGIYVNAVLYPAVQRDRALLRTSYTSEHTREHLDLALEIFAKMKKKHGW